MQRLRQQSLYFCKLKPQHLLMVRGRINNLAHLSKCSHPQNGHPLQVTSHCRHHGTSLPSGFNTQPLTNRYFSFSGGGPKNVGDEKDADKDEDGDENAPSSPGIMKRFKDTYKTYGKLLIVVHTMTSCVWYGSFYYAAVSGVDIVPLLEKIGFGQAIIGPFQQSGLGHFAVAYLLYKLATPARYTVTVVGTQLTARKLRDLGIMKPIPEGSSLRELASESRDKVRGVQSDMKEKIRLRHEELKEDIKDTTQKAKQKAEEIKEKIQDIKDSNR